MTPRYAQRMAEVQPSAIRELLALGAVPSMISFSGGYTDATLFVVAQMAYVPRATFFPLIERNIHARLNLSSPSPDALRTGIAALGKALHANQ